MKTFILILFPLLIISFLPYTKFFKLFNKIYLAFILLFLVFNTNNPDYEAYQRIFEFNNPDGIADIGFVALIKVTKLLGFSDYRVILVILGLLILGTFIRYSKHIKNLNFVVLLYFIFPFIMDVIQIRNTFMLFILLNAVLEYYNNKKLRCIILLLISSTFHIFGVVSIVLFILIEYFQNKNNELFSVNFENNKTLYNFVIVFGITNVIIGKHIVTLIQNYSPIEIIRVKLQTYTSDSLNFDSIIVWGLILITDLIFFYFLLRGKRIQGKDAKLIYILYLLMFSGLTLLGSMLYITEFNRFFRLLFIVKYLLYGVLDNYLNKNEKNIAKIYLITTCLILAVIYFKRGINYDDILLSNQLLNWL